MKLMKPNWVSHDNNPIFSIDIHPDGKRFATGGQGGDSGRVVIWNFVPVIDEAAESDENVPKMLCQLDNHLACVNCVRWSSGGLLASGGDDKLIMIWRFSGQGSTSVFGGKSCVETWRCISTLRSHEGDILDLAWAPNSQWLASASVDNNVIVWDALKFPTIVAVLKGHTGLVKGVSWDPVGKFLASQSDDKTLRVWRTNDWSEEALITKPFDDCGGTTHVLRLSWSPDGQYLVSAHAMNGGGPTAQIIERSGWKQDKDFVGHRKAVTCVRFNSNICQGKLPGGVKSQKYCCLAIGSRDRAVSVWLTSLKRPLIVIRELFTHSVMDASWSPCGFHLAACSWDGTVAFITFSTQELGQPLNEQQKNHILESEYGKQTTKGGCTVMESAEMLNIAPVIPATPTAKTNNSVTNCVPLPVSAAPTTPVKGPINKQIETRTSDGRRRITPMFIPPPAESLDNSTSRVGPPAFTSTSQTKSTIVIEKRDDVVTPNVSTVMNSLPPTNNSIASLKRRENSTAKPQASQNKRAKISGERAGAQMILPSLKPINSLSQQAGHYAVTVNNSQGMSHVQVFQGNVTEPTWELNLGYSTVGVAASPAVIVLGLEDGSIHTFHPAKGTRLAPPLAPPAPLAKITANGNKVMVISSCGDVRVWEIDSTCRMIVSTSASHLAAPGSSLLSCTLHNGMPHLSFTNSRAYMYHREMGTWILVGDSHDPVWRWSSINALTSYGARPPRGPLSVLQEGLNAVGRTFPSSRMPHSARSIVSYLEQQLLVSKSIGSAQEYSHWLNALVNFLLTQDGLEKRLRFILDDLLGPTHGSASKSSWDPVILGIKKHKLLSNLLLTISQQLRWQRLYIEYKDQLQTVNNMHN